MDRKEIKAKAQELMFNNLGKFWKGYLLILAINVLISIISRGIYDINSAGLSFITIFLTLLMIPLSVGIMAYVLKIARGKKVDFNDIFVYCKLLLPLIALEIIITVFVTLWSILLIIPGIIAGISYSMALYIFIDGEKEPLECIRQSKKMIDGYKWNYVVFNLSFIGWAIFGALTFGIGYIWVIPYYQFAQAIYYDELKNKTKPKKLKDK